VPPKVPAVFWLRPDDLLAPAATDLSCGQEPAEVVQDLLALLAAPGTTERDADRGSAIPSTAKLRLVAIEDGVAEVELDPLALGDAERLPLAVGQVVLSVTSAPGVDAVRIVTSGRAVDLPLPSGALATGEATAKDYATLLPKRMRHEVFRPGNFGCPPPGT
jgi:hypothetical protein